MRLTLCLAAFVLLAPLGRGDDAATCRAKVALALSGAGDREQRVKAALCGCGNCGRAAAPMPRAKPSPKDNGCGCKDCQNPYCPTGRTTPCTCDKKAAKPPCVCGADCKCKDGECPGKCPVTPAGAAEPHPGQTELWLINGQYYRVPVGQRPTFGVPNCPSGNCPTGR